MKSSFSRAQESWEQSWINGPEESPTDSYIESLADKSLSELEDEKATLAYQEPDDEMPSHIYRAAHAAWKSAWEALDYEIEERQKAVRIAFENLPLHRLFSFSTTCPLEQEILDEVKEEFSSSIDEDE
jgi:hypothetical protein